MSILLADIDATCAAFGYTDGDRYQAEPDALQGLKHLIWILRRDLDNHEYRRHLGHAKVLQTDFVYMLPDYIDDDEFADVLIRLLVILTNPTLLLYRDGPPKDNHGRKVFLELIDILQGYKSAFARDKVWSALFGKLQKSLEIDWALRNEEQNLLIERILVLIRNVLQVPANPEVECRADNDASLHDQVIWALHQSGILDLVLFVISSPDEHQFHLHGLEILCLIFREQTAESLADASLQRSASEKQRDEQELMAARRREKERTMSKPPPGRHSRFGGTYVIRNLKSVSDRDIICHQPLERVAAIDFDREKEQQRRSFRHVKEEVQVKRRSAFSVRLCLREYCIEILRSAYNTLVRQVRRVLERNSGSTTHDDSYLLWAIRFFMEFNRLSGLELHLVSESLSVQCFHWVLTRMQHDMDMIVSDKKQARPWAKRLHVALQTFRELLLSLLALQKLQDDNAAALFDMLLNNVCYVLEYRETILHLLMNYNEAHSTKAYLRDVVETANIFIKMMERFCKDSVLVQDKKRQSKKRSNKKTKKFTKSPQQIQEELANKWAEKAAEVSNLLCNELQIPEEDQPIPFDATSDKSIDDQKEDCMIRIHKILHEEKLERAIALMRAAREVWPENDIFGAMSAAPEDELLLLREIFLHNITTVEIEDENPNVSDDEDNDDENEDEQEDNGMIEKTFKFDDFAKRLINAKIVRACTVVLSDWEQIPTKSLKAAVTILHRIAYGCSCPAMLYQAKLFRIFQQVLHAARDAHQEELRRLGIFVVRKFVETAPTNPKIYAELLFYKSVKEANELESGYCDAYEAGTKGVWNEEQETELRLLFEENQKNPETDKDVIDWILENLIDKTRTRRGVLKKLKEMDLRFKAPTKKSAAAAGKNLWQPEEDEELRSLYDQYRTEEDCLQRILEEFALRRNKQQIIKRMLQLHMIADKSEILPQKPRKRRPKINRTNSGTDDDEDDDMREPQFGGIQPKAQIKTTKALKNKTKKPQKAPKRKIVRTSLDVGTIRALLSEIDNDKYQEALDWLKECLNEAAEEIEEPSEEDDGVPLVPLREVQREAMEDANFLKVLIALGVQPPIMGIENYWRIPIYLNAADLTLRAKIVAGEQIDINIEDVDNDINNDETVDEYEYNETDEEDLSDDGYMKSKSKQSMTGYLEKQREKLNSIMFNESDDEENKSSKTRKEKKEPQVSDASEDEIDVFEQLKQRRAKSNQQEKFSKDKEEGLPKSNSGGDLFDQLKAKRTAKIKLAEMAVEINNSEENDELNINSEDYRKRLMELGDSESDENEIEEKQTTKIRAKRANIIDSDSDEYEDNTPNEPFTLKDKQNKDINNKGNAEVDDNENENEDENNDVVAKASNQMISNNIAIANDNDTLPTTSDANNKKRRRPQQRESSLESDNDNNNANANVNNASHEEEDVGITIRKKLNATTIIPAADEAPTKRRRIAIISDDDDEDY